MPELRDVCRYIRSKNAGPFWVTVDLFFKDQEAYEAYARHPALSANLFSVLYGTPAEQVRLFHVDRLLTLKISYPRTSPQGWRGERDMHSGQQYARLLKVALDP